MAGEVLAILFLIVEAYCLFDAITAPRREIRTLPKFLWVVLIFFIPGLGSVLWLTLGRPKATYEPVEAVPGVRSRPVVRGPEDAPDFEERIQRGLRRQAQHDDEDG
jgi:hypothetical protein